MVFLIFYVYLSIPKNEHKMCQKARKRVQNTVPFLFILKNELIIIYTFGRTFQVHNTKKLSFMATFMLI